VLVDLEDKDAGAGECATDRVKSNVMQAHAKVAIYSCLVNAILMSFKYGLGHISGSLALKADAIHSLADVVSSFTIFLGIVISDRKTRTFPEGLYKVENLVALASSIFIFFAAYEIGYEALKGHALGKLQNVPLVLFGITSIMAVAFLFSRYELKVGLAIGSPSLVADAKHVATDLLSTFVILFSIIGNMLGYSIDKYVALFVALLVARIGSHILVDALKVLLDATLDYETLNQIRRILESHPDVIEVISLGGRSSGRYKFVEVSLKVDTRLLREAHEIISSLEEEILDLMPSIDKILIHYEPERKEFKFVAVALDVPQNGIPDEDVHLSNHFGEAAYFAILRKELRNGKVIVRGYEKNPFVKLERHKGVKVAEFLAELHIDEVVSRANLVGKGSGYALEALQIDYSLTNAETLRELVQELHE
jgi:cation diffusion facilitator family transporter